MVANFLAGLVVGFGFCSIFVLFLLNTRIVADKDETPVLDKFKFWKPEPEAPKDYPVQSIPRTSGPWRRRKQALEASHNSKQKERDALTRGL